MTTLLGTTLPVLAAPMAGGPTTPELVRSAAGVGSMGFLAAGYRSAAELAGQISAVDGLFGVNVFAPNPVPVDPSAFRRYAVRLQPEADAYGLDLATAPIVEHDDDWDAKIDLLLSSPVPVVSFTFALPPTSTVRALQRAGTLVLQTVTSTVEAQAAADLGVDGLIVQSAAAGAHSGTFTPTVFPTFTDLSDLLRSVRARVDLPLIAAGGVGTAADVASALAAGAEAVMVGTALLRTDESGASAVHKAALASAATRATQRGLASASGLAAQTGLGAAAGLGAQAGLGSLAGRAAATTSDAAAVEPGTRAGAGAAGEASTAGKASSAARAGEAAGPGEPGEAARTGEPGDRGGRSQAGAETGARQVSTVDGGATLLTRAFSGRPARALRNGFVDRHHDAAPSGYPAVHYLTSPLRKAAAQAGDPERVNLWAGTGFRHAASGPAGVVLVALAAKA